MDHAAPSPLANLLLRTRLDDERARFLGRSTSEPTRRTYEQDLRHFFKWLGCLEGIPSLEEVTRVSWREIVAYRDHFYGHHAPLSLTTGARRLSVLKSFYEALMSARVVAQNPVSGISRPRAPEEGRTAGLTPEDVNRILALAPRGTLRADRDRLFLGFLFFQWLRISEAVRLRTDDLALEQGIPVLYVRQKGGKERKLALRRELYDLTRETATRHKLTGFLFPTLSKGHSEERAISKDGARRLIWRPAVLRAGFDPEEITPHSARVSGITAALLQDVPLQDVQDFAGHQRPDTTLRYFRARQRLDRAPVGVLPFTL
jgi:site-specific recombinase XerD